MLGVIVSVLGVVSCAQDGESAVVLPTTGVSDIRPSWAVVVSTYVRLRDEADSESPITGHLRAGDVAEVVSISLSPYSANGHQLRWIELAAEGHTGWVLENDLQLFSSERRARNAAVTVQGSEVSDDQVSVGGSDETGGAGGR